VQNNFLESMFFERFFQIYLLFSGLARNYSGGRLGLENKGFTKPPVAVSQSDSLSEHDLVIFMARTSIIYR